MICYNPQLQKYYDPLDFMSMGYLPSIVKDKLFFINEILYVDIIAQKFTHST